MIIKPKSLPQESCIYQNRIAPILNHPYQDHKVCAHYLKEHGRFYTDQDCDDTLIANMEFKIKRCYQNTIMLVLRHYHLQFVDGFYWFKDAPGLVIPHSFAVDPQGRVHDPARKLLERKASEYFGLVLPLDKVIEQYPNYTINDYLKEELCLTRIIHIA